METVVEVNVPPDRFVLGETLDRVPDVELRPVRLAVRDSARTMPLLWGATSRPERLAAALRADRVTERVRRLSGDDRGLYAVAWTDRAAAVVDRFAATTGTVIDLRGTPDGWTFEILFPDRTTASRAFQALCDDGVDPSPSRVGTLCAGDDETGLSARQHSAIAAAFRAGYYAVPRETTLEELAADFEVSHQALSERLRRGHATLVQRLLSGPTTESGARP